jgi:hypothetical protein
VNDSAFLHWQHKTVKLGHVDTDLEHHLLRRAREVSEVEAESLDPARRVEFHWRIRDAVRRRLEVDAASVCRGSVYLVESVEQSIRLETVW